jgi:hypothetical protein
MRSIKRQLQDDRRFVQNRQLFARSCFQDGWDSPSLQDHLTALDFELPRLPTSGRAAFAVSSLIGDLSAAIHVVAAGHSDSPVLVFHHDFGDNPPTRAMKAAFGGRRADDLAVYVVEAPFHDHPRARRTASRSLAAHLAMQAVSVAATEQLLRASRVAQAPLRIVAGYGQGGFVTNRHHMIHDSADLYIPLMAGTAEAELFLAGLPSSPRAKRQPEQLRDRLNFDEDWRERDHRNVFPVLGSADSVNLFTPQARSYDKTPIEVWPVSHTVGEETAERIRAKILRHVDEAMTPRAAAPLAAPVAGRLRLVRLRG